MFNVSIRSARCADIACGLGGVTIATAGLLTLFDRPSILFVFLLIITSVFLMRWQRRSDYVGLFVGATFGNLTELLCDAAGVWEHPTRQVFGLAPLYIFGCYPLLGLALPRMIAGVASRERPEFEGEGSTLLHASLIWAAHAGLSCRFGRNNDLEMLVCLLCLVLTLARFHSTHDLITALLGGLLGMAWELPCTISGVWRFPDPQFLGLIPLWLPLAYAIFFVNLCRITAAISQRIDVRVSNYVS